MTPSVQKNRGFTGMVPPAPPDGSPHADRYKASDMAKDRLPAETRRSMRAAGFLWPDYRPTWVPEISTLESKKNIDGRMEVSA
jgi:hypothetical protein